MVYEFRLGGELWFRSRNQERVYDSKGISEVLLIQYWGLVAIMVGSRSEVMTKSE